MEVFLMDNKQVVDHEVILERTKAYGNNFPTMAKLWKTFFKMKYGIEVPIQNEDVPFLMQLHKISRLMVSPDNQDSMQDMYNYAWIGFNYEEYENASKPNNEEQVVNYEKLINYTITNSK